MTYPIDTADRLLQQLQSLRPLKPEDQARLDKKFRLEFSYNSNHLEGNTLTYAETELLLIFEETIGSHSKRELDEMQAHDVAYQLIQEWAQDPERPLSEIQIKNLNEIILVRPFWKEAITPDGQPTQRLIKVGDYKEYPNHVLLQSGEVFRYAAPGEETRMAMGDLMDWYRSDHGLHPIALAAMLHYRFVRIHPFDDGNGRVARLLMNYVLLKDGYPPIIVKSADKESYRRALHLADVGDTPAFMDYIGQQAIWSLELAIKAAKGESIEEPDDIDKEITLFRRSMDTNSARTALRNNENISSIIQYSAIPLFEELRRKLSRLDEFFHTREDRIVFSTTVSPIHDFHARRGGYMLSTAQFPESALNWLHSPKVNGDITAFSFEYRLKGYKYGRPDDAAVLLTFNFEEYNYRIARKGAHGVMDKEYQEWSYSRQLSTEEQMNLVNDVTKAVFETVKTIPADPTN